MDKPHAADCLTIPLPGDRVARVPLSVLESYVDPGARAAHGTAPVTPGGGNGEAARSATLRLGAEGGAMTVNIFIGAGGVNAPARAGAGAVGDRGVQEPSDGADDVTAHGLSIDSATGSSVWHTDWELGPCDYTDESGTPHSTYAWHRHPYGTEYAELYKP